MDGIHKTGRAPLYGGCISPKYPYELLMSGVHGVCRNWEMNRAVALSSLLRATITGNSDDLGISIFRFPYVLLKLST